IEGRAENKSHGSLIANQNGVQNFMLVFSRAAIATRADIFGDFASAFISRHGVNVCALNRVATNAVGLLILTTIKTSRFIIVRLAVIKCANGKS
ncbi:MAG: hypothetical protein ACREFE_10630, partial [Limisphaerales bacterium]